MPLKLAMLGMVQAHAAGIVRQVAEHPDEFTLVGFYDPDPEVVATLKSQWAPLLPSFHLFDSPQALLGADIDGVVVETPQHSNLKMARLALESGRPVLLEKPAGDHLDEHRRLVELAQRKNLHVQMLYLFRYMSAVQEMLARARRGELGDVYEFRARLPKPLDSYDRYAAELGRYQGGMFFEMAGHVIDMLVAILGKPDSVTPFLAHHHRRPGAFIDNGLAVFGFQRAWGIIEVPSLEVAPRSRRIEVYGTAGACAIPHLGTGHLLNSEIQPIEVYRAGAADWERLDLPAATLQIADLREFAAVIAGRKTPDFSMEHDLIVQEALLAASGMLA